MRINRASSGFSSEEVPHPIPYQGSKRLIATDILKYFPPDVDVLIEPFAGSAAISLASAFTNRATRFLLSDSNSSLMALWEEIINHPDDLIRLYSHLWHEQTENERDYYNLVRTRFNQEHLPGDFLYLLARCVKASVRYNSYGEFNQSPDNRRKGARPTTMAHHIRAASHLLRERTEVLSGDYRSSVQRATTRDLIYMDPPYQGVSETRDTRYFKGVAFGDFVEALAEMNDRGLSYIVSYDGHTSIKSYGKKLPIYLNLEHIHIRAGRSSQATLLGLDVQTVESLYLSPSLIQRLKIDNRRTEIVQCEMQLQVCA